MTENYYEIDRMSFSGLKQAEKSAQHYRNWKESANVSTPSMDLGSYVDALLLDPAALEDFVVRPDTYTDSKGLQKPWTMASNSCKDWMRDNAGKQIITSDQHHAANKMAHSVREHEEAAEILGQEDIQTQKKILWTESSTGIDMKSKLDIWCPESRTLVDLKTTVDASAGAFARTVASFRYYVQLAMYADALEFAGEKMPNKYLIIAVENTAPYCTAVYSINGMDIDIGRKWYKNVLNKYKNELENCQIGYSKYAEPLQLPTWIGYEV